jgi:hypothetical protein
MAITFFSEKNYLKIMHMKFIMRSKVNIRILINIKYNRILMFTFIINA